MFCARAISCCILESLEEARVKGDVNRRGRTLASDEFESHRRRFLFFVCVFFFFLLRLTRSLRQPPPPVHRTGGVGECGGGRCSSLIADSPLSVASGSVFASASKQNKNVSGPRRVRTMLAETSWNSTRQRTRPASNSGDATKSSSRCAIL